MKKRTIGNMIAVLAGLSLSASAHAAQPADLVIKNASVPTMDEANPTADAVAITGDTITFAEPSVPAGPLSHLDVGHYWQGKSAHRTQPHTVEQQWFPRLPG